MANKTSLLKMHEQNAPKELVASMENLCTALEDLVDVRRNPSQLFSSEMIPIVSGIVMEGVSESIRNIGYDPEEVVFMEGMTEDKDEESVPVSVEESHIANLTSLMENSGSEYRIANERNLNEITPFDAFLPFTIVRSYLPLVGKDILPYVVPKVPFVRIKEKFKYIVTKDNKSYLRPDVYNDPEAINEILKSAKGRAVTNAWFPAGTEVAEDAEDFDYEVDGVKYKAPTDPVRVTVDVLAESGGVVEIGDALDIDVHVEGARGVVVNSEGETQVIEAHHLEAYPDITSYSPQRSINAVIKYAVKNSAGEVEEIIEDRIQGMYNHRTSTFEVMSFHGITKQICFGGHLSNKNNTEYISYRNEYNSYEHPIPEGFNMAVPLTLEDEQLYKETSSISIIADAVSECTEIFTNSEDMSILYKFNEEFNRWNGVAGDEHPFVHFQKGPVVFDKEVDVAYTNGQLLKRNQYVQDAVQYALSRLVGEVRTTCGNDPFKIVLFCHPNIASLFVGDNIDWKITPGTAVAEGIRSDYNMGIYTANGDTMRLVASQKFSEADGVRGIILPVNETNFLSWKQFKYSLIFSKDYRISEMQNNPAIRGLSRFHTQSYVPLQLRLQIKNYK